MRILIVHDYGVCVGGAEQLSLAIRNHLRARGHEARLFTSSARPQRLPIRADSTGFGTMSPARRITQAWNPFAARALKTEIRTFKPDVVHLRMFMTQLSPAILDLLHDIPTVLHLVNYDLVCPLNTRVLPDASPCPYTPGSVCGRTGCLGLLGLARAQAQQLGWRRGTQAIDYVIANSDRVAHVHRSHGVNVNDVVLNGVPERPTRPPLNDTSAPRIGYAGRLVAKKGVACLLEAVATVSKSIPDIRLSVVGDGPERASLAAEAERLGIHGLVDWHGHVSRDELEALFADVWVQVVPSLWEEPFGLVAAEGMMRGCAVIATNGGGLAEQVVDGHTGYLVPPGDASALASRLVALLGDRSLAEAMGQAGRRRALDQFTEARVVDQCLTIYQSLAATRSRGPV